MHHKQNILKIAIGIISRNGLFLITKRASHKAHGDVWEFPGGKIELEELPEQTLVRELKEEVNLDILDYTLWQEINYQGSQSLRLLVFVINRWKGIPRCCEDQQALAWVAPQDLKHYSFPPANAAFLAQLTTLSLLAK